jgi:hypothetical protein
MVRMLDELLINSDPIAKSQAVSLIAFRAEILKWTICHAKKGHPMVEGD